MSSAFERSDLGNASDEELFGEIRRRDISGPVVRRQLRLSDNTSMIAQPDPHIRLRFIALLILGLLTAAVLAIVAYLSVSGKIIPDLISGLAGSGIGAIAGILAGGGSQSPAPQVPSQEAG